MGFSVKSAGVRNFRSFDTPPPPPAMSPWAVRISSPATNVYDAVPSSGDTFAVGASSGGLVAKFDNTGQALWARRVATVDNFQVGMSDGAGGVIVSGQRASVNRPVYARFDGDGNLLWLSQYSTGRYGRAMVRTQDGNIVIGHYQTNVLVKLDIDGNFVWQRSLNNISYGITGLSETSAGEILAVGDSNGYANLYKLNADGTAMWRKHFPTTGTIFNHAAEMSDGKIVTAGKVPTNDDWVMLLDDNDTDIGLLWSRSFSAVSTSEWRNIGVAGSSIYLMGSGGSKPALAKTDATPTGEYLKTYDTFSASSFWNARLANDHIYVAATASTSFALGRLGLDGDMGANDTDRALEFTNVGVASTFYNTPATGDYGGNLTADTPTVTDLTLTVASVM